MHPILELLEMDTLTGVARTCGVTPQAIYDWRAKARRAPKKFRIPAEHVRPLCRAYGMFPADLRPDLFEAHWRYKG